MPSKDPVQRFQDILDNIASIRTYLAGVDRAAFLEGGMTYDAVSYCFVRLSEAATKLGAEAERLETGVSWRNIRGLGNQLRHSYDGIDPAILWDTAEQSFPVLEAACRSAIKRLDRGS